MEGAGALREIAFSIAGLKRQPEHSSEQLQALSTDCLLQLLAVKESNKRFCLGVEAVREQTAAAKQQLELADTTLQNLLYERSYYEKEIHSCLSFASAVRDEQVRLIARVWCGHHTGRAGAGTAGCRS